MTVYFIRAGTDGLVKIGRARDVNKRLLALGTMAPVKLDLIRTIEGGLQQEMKMHAHYNDIRRHGEWFEFCESMLVIEPFPIESVIVKPRKSASAIADLINALGGATVLAKIMALPRATVADWAFRGIPAKRWPAISRLCAERAHLTGADPLLQRVTVETLETMSLRFSSKKAGAHP